MALESLPIFFKLLIWFEEHPDSNLWTAATELKVTYGHLEKIKNYMLTRNWINVRKESRSLVVTLTSSGRDVALAYKFLLEKMGEDKNAEDISN